MTELPPVNVLLGGDNIVNLEILNTEEDLTGQLSNPQVPGLGEVWVNTQFEITDAKSKPGTATRVNVPVRIKHTAERLLHGPVTVFMPAAAGIIRISFLSA